MSSDTRRVFDHRCAYSRAITFQLYDSRNNHASAKKTFLQIQDSGLRNDITDIIGGRLR